MSIGYLDGYIVFMLTDDMPRVLNDLPQSGRSPAVEIEGMM